MPNLLYVATLDRGHEGLEGWGFGRTPETALAHLIVGVSRDKPDGRAFLDQARDEIHIRGVCIGKGYILSDTDSLWSEEHYNGAAQRVAAVWSDPDAFRPDVDDIEEFWMVRGETVDHGFPIDGYGETPEEALEGILTMWRYQHVPMSGADPDYIDSRIRDEMTALLVPANGDIVMINGEPEVESLPLSDPRFDVVFEKCARTNHAVRLSR